MRCPKCQYVGFEPSPRCKNCGYDFSLGSSEDRTSDDAPALTLVTEPEYEGPMADFELQIFDDVPAMKVQAGAKPFDLDELLANGPSSRSSEPVIETVSAVARRRRSSSASASVSASAVATPPPMAVESLFKPSPVAQTADIDPVVEPATPMEVAAIEPAMSLTIEAEPEPEPEPHPAPAARVAPVAPVTTELPLFMAPVPVSVEAATAAAGPEADDRPLVQVPAVPRAPLAVRRTTPDPARLRAKYSRGAARAKADHIEMSGDLLNGVDQPEPKPEPQPEPRIVPPAHRLSAEPTPTSLPAEWLQGVGPSKRLMAAALDSALLVSLNAAVIWFTLSVCGLTTGQVNLLPVAPLLLFFLLLDAGYLVLFTAACGQTLGKMAAGIRVVGTSASAVINDRITLSQAVMRSLGAIVSMVPLGAGFWFGLVGDRRAIHDRLAHTRVVSL